MIISKKMLPSAIGALVLGLTGCATAPAPEPVEANPPIKMAEALKNIDMGMKMMGDMDMMMKTVMGKQQETLALGNRLFNDPTLSGATQGVSCNSCHPGGGTTGGEAEIPPMMGYPGWNLPIPDLHGSAATFPKFKVPNAEVITLSQMNNNCLMMFVGGKKRLPLNARESHAIALYVTSLSKGEAVEPGKMGMMK
ncbi:MAG: cytochrome c peroxidase [Candidatus Neomarinimicrobiota bacterium]